ncbi:uncharacterized protein [Notamacropus eugenii]|uniref:uncharacterized protein n=1 Tax=Notamacropus eugenii TaxID=9315 RepID=UPI003B678807
MCTRTCCKCRWYPQVYSIPGYVNTQVQVPVQVPACVYEHTHSGPDAGTHARHRDADARSTRTSRLEEIWIASCLTFLTTGKASRGQNQAAQGRFYQAQGYPDKLPSPVLPPHLASSVREEPYLTPRDVTVLEPGGRGSRRRAGPGSTSRCHFPSFRNPLPPPKWRLRSRAEGGGGGAEGGAGLGRGRERRGPRRACCPSPPSVSALNGAGPAEWGGAVRRGREARPLRCRSWGPALPGQPPGTARSGDAWVSPGTCFPPSQKAVAGRNGPVIPLEEIQFLNMPCFERGRPVG